MPNLYYDPTNPTDLLDRPIAEGDIVAWGTSASRSLALCIATIEKIRYTCVVQTSDGAKEIECTQAAAEKYTLRLKPIKSTGWITDSRFIYDPVAKKGHHEKLQGGAKVKTVYLVKNVVKLEEYSVAP